MSANPKKSAKLTIGSNRAVVRVDEDQLTLSSLTGISATTNDDDGIPTSLNALVAEGAVIKAVCTVLVGTRRRNSPIYITAEEIGKGSLAKLEGQTYRGGVIRSARIPRRAVFS